VSAIAVAAACLAVTACGGASGPARRPPTGHDVAVIAQAMSDVVYQCQSVAVGLTANPDAAAIRRDVDALLGAYRRVQPDAKLTIGPLHTTLRRELGLARANLQAGCATGAARRLADASRR
jgi:hypothetical protein